MTFTENVSLHGARVVTVRRWLPETRVLVTLLRNGVRSEGRVAYCQRKETGGFAIGIELSGQGQDRIGNLCFRQLDLAPFDLLFWPHPLVIHHSAPGRSETLRRTYGDAFTAPRTPWAECKLYLLP